MNGLIKQCYHKSFTSSAQQTWTFPIIFTNANSFTITPTAWANSNNSAPLQYIMFQKVTNSQNQCTGVKFMSLTDGEHNFITIGY